MPALLVLLIAIVVIAVLGLSVFSLGFTILWWALIGLVIGGLGRLVAPGGQSIGLGTTILSGDLPDQAALFGVLSMVERLGLKLLAVSSEPHQEAPHVE